VHPTSVALTESLDVFARGAREQQADPRSLERLLSIQKLLGEELGWVEENLQRLSAEGVSPATDAAMHLVGQGGKRVRPLAALLSASCFGPLSPKCRTVALVAEVIHSATLLHDDVADDGRERRGTVVSRLVYGNAVSVLGGDLLLVHALQRTASDVPELLPSLLRTLRALVDGEVLQLRGRTELDLRYETYDRILRGKTASLFGWATEGGAAQGGATPEQQAVLREFGEQIGVAFQLVDDLLDYVGTNTGKSSLVDLREGKLTLPLVLAVRKIPALAEAIARIHAGDLFEVERVGRDVADSGVCTEVRAQALAVTQRAVTLLESLPHSQSRELLRGVALDLASRVA
jgi:octaprenyl-diphosphate synthase